MTTTTELEDLDLLATVFDVARTGICVISERGLFTKVNPAFCAMVGYASEELVGREYAICAPPAVVAVKEKFLAANLADSPKIPTEWQIRRRDGSLFDALVSSRPVTRKNGQRFLVVTFSDITERKAMQARAEQLNAELEARIEARTVQLRENERKYQRIIDVTREGFWLVDGWSRTLEVNQPLCRLLGYTMEELLALPPEEVFDPQHRAFVRGALYPRPKPGHDQFELDMLTKEGERIPVLINAATQLNAQGEPEFAAAFITDISKRKQLERALEETLHEREGILNLSVVGIAFVRNRDFVWVNKAFEQDMLGYEAGELAGKSSIMTYPSPEMYNDLGPQIDKALVEQGTFQTEERVRRKDGSMMWCLVTGRIVEAGDLSKGSIWTIVDISKRRAAEVELLESLAREKEASELKSRFVSMTSHEFRTPLAAILSSIELIADYGERLPGEEKSELVGVIKSSVKRMSQMLEDILVIGRADAGRLEFNPEPVDLKSLCERIAQEATKTTQTAHEVELQCTLKKKRYLLDERLVRHVLHNLLINAIKYSPHSGRVCLRVMAEEASMKFIVEDQGIGIPLEDQAGLFTSFYRGANVGSIAGTGLGLAIVKKAVDLHGGSICVESTVGKGSQFSVILPEA
ncbi:MAG: PAS domain S-box protein, partial [Burkholderiales bacterium]